MVKLRKPVMVHGYMIYGCDHCGRVFTMFLENGIEDAEGDALGHPHKPSPFCIPCKCGDFACDISGIRKLEQRRKIRKTENYFANKKNKDCGTPIMKEW